MLIIPIRKYDLSLLTSPSIYAVFVMVPPTITVPPKEPRSPASPPPLRGFFISPAGGRFNPRTSRSAGALLPMKFKKWL